MHDLTTQFTAYSLVNKSAQQKSESEDTQWSSDFSFYTEWFSYVKANKNINVFEGHKLLEVIRTLKENELFFKLISNSYNISDELNKNIKNLTEVVANFNNHHNLTLNAIYSEKWELSKPIYVSIEKNCEDEYITCLFEADVYGYGVSIPDSIEDFISTLISQYEFLLSEKESLGEIPKRQLVILNQLLKEK